MKIVYEQRARRERRAALMLTAPAGGAAYGAPYGGAYGAGATYAAASDARGWNRYGEMVSFG